MNEIVSEWVQKAQADLLTSRRELAVQDDPNYDAVCFHAQQCAEKLIKAVLISKGEVPPRTHDLVWLSELLSSVVRSWDWPRQELRLLGRAAVDFRYPGEAADREEAEEAVSIASSVQAKLLEML
jgi:HEPN domain-containing protein